MPWRPSDIVVVALYNFAGTGQHQLPLNAGDTIQVKEECDLWYRGWVMGRRGRIGIFPATYVRQKQYGEAFVHEDPVVVELTRTLREWGMLLRSYFNQELYSEFSSLKELLSILVGWRRALMSSQSTEKQKVKLRALVTQKIEEGRRALGLDIVPLLPDGEEATENNCNIIAMHEAHVKAAMGDEFSSRGKLSKTRRGDAAGDDLPPACHILIHIKAFICSAGEDTELFFSIWDATKKTFITEPFQVCLTKMGMPKDQDKIGRLRCVFYDLDIEDLTSDGLFLVCRICRQGAMLYDDTAPMSSSGSKAAADATTFRRPFGYAILAINAAMLHEREISAESEYLMPIQAPLVEGSFHNLHEALIAGNREYREVPRAKGVCVGIKMFRGPWEPLVEAREECQRVPIVRSLSFRDLVDCEPRNDLYVRLDTGDFLKDMKTAEKNIRVDVEVMDEAGNVIPNCITMGGGEPPASLFQSLVIYHDNKPVWNEVLRVSIPAAQFTTAHLLFTFSHCSTSSGKMDKGFSFTFMRLLNPDGTVVQDGVHTLTTYKFARAPVGASYLVPDKAAARKESLTVTTQLVSTELTQNGRLLSLLQWQQCIVSEIPNMLEGVTFVDHSEIVKFLAEVFSALFAVMEAQRTNKAVLTAVVDTIVYLINILVEARSARMRKCRVVLDNYIDNLFRAPNVDKVLSSVLRDALTNLRTAKPKQINSAVKGLHYIFKFIAKSRAVSGAAGSRLDPNVVPPEMDGLLSALNNMMSLQEPPWIIGSQTILVKYFTMVVDELSSMFSSSQVASIVCKFADSIAYDESKKQLNTEKLLLLNVLVQGNLDAQARAIAVPSVIAQLKNHLDKGGEEGELCVLIVADILDKITSDVGRPVDGAVLWELVQMLRPILTTFLSLSATSSLRRDIVTVILGLFYYMDALLFERHLGTFPSAKEKAAYLEDVVTACATITLEAIYPVNWATMRLIQFRVVLNVLNNYSGAFEYTFSSKKTFAFESWCSVFKLGLGFMAAKDLRLESMNAVKRDAVFSRNGDLRMEMMPVINNLWRTIPLDKKDGFIPTLIPYVLNISLIPQPQLRELSHSLYFDLLETEFKKTANFKSCNHTTIDTLDELIRDASMEQVLCDFFEVLVPFVNGHSDRAFVTSGLVFLNEMKQMVVLLCELRSLPDGPEYEDDRAIATMKLADYLKSTERFDAYFKYVHQLKDLHVAGQNFTEAGYALLLHAHLLEWDTVNVAPADFGLPAGPIAVQKEALFMQAIGFFEVGRSWEEAIKLCAALADHYENRTFDYKKLATILEKKASFHNLIVTQDRFYSEYFRTAYYGRGFPATLKGKEFVYRGNSLERIGDFISRLQDKFPSATILMANSPPDDSVINSAGQFIQVALIECQSEYKPTAAPGVSLHPFITKYHAVNNVKKFSFSRRIDKVKKNKDNEFATLWILNTVIETSDSFPTIHRRLEVTRRTETEWSPIENAIMQVRDKSAALLGFYNGSLNAAEAPSSYTMALNGTIDAAVNGGTKQFLDAFLTQEYKRGNPKDAPLIAELRALLLEQIQLLEKMLELHARIVPPAMQGLHSHLETLFPKTRAEMMLFLQ